MRESLGVFKKSLIITKKHTKDFTLRLSASVVSTLASKVVLLPILALIFSEEEYGLMLTVIGVESLISLVFGNSLYTVRMIMNTEYVVHGAHGDFNILAVVISILAGLFIIPIGFLFPSITLLDRFLLIPYLVLATANLYFSVYYSVMLKFKDGLYQSIITAIGLLVGLPIAWMFHSWVICYLSSAIFGFLWLMWRTEILREPFKKTVLFRITLNKYYLLMIATVLGNGVVYLDRFILYPLIGASAVSIYITASYFGKSLSVIAQPASNVMFSYFAQGNFSMTMKKYGVINLLIVIFFVLFIFLSMFFGKFITKLLFPNFVESAVPYIFIANVSAGVSALTQLIKPIALKFAATKWQTIIQLTYVVMYVSVGILSLQFYGLMGFCYSVLIVNVLQFVAQDLICYMVVRNKKS